MAIVFDAATSDNGTFDTVFPAVVLTVGALTSRILVIDIARIDGTETISSVAVNGSTTGVVFYGFKEFNDGARQRRIDRYYKLNPASGSNSVVVALSGQTNAWSVGLHSWSGVDQTTPFGTIASASADSVGPITVNVSTSAGQVVLDAAVWGTSGQTVTVGAGQNQRINNGATAVAAIAVSEETAGGASTTMSWTLSGQAQWAQLAAVLNAAGGGAADPLMGAFMVS